MNAFKPGDLVMVMNSPDGSMHAIAGHVSTIASRCSGCECALFSELTLGLSFYQLTALPGSCFRESILKKIEGDSRSASTKTDETRDAPVEA